MDRKGPEALRRSLVFWTASCGVLKRYKIRSRLCRQIVTNLAAHIFDVCWKAHPGRFERHCRFVPALNIFTVVTRQWCSTSRRFIVCSFRLFRFSYIFSFPLLFCQLSSVYFKRSTVLLISWHNHCFKLSFPPTPFSCRYYYAYSTKVGSVTREVMVKASQNGMLRHCRHFKAICVGSHWMIKR